MNYKQTIQISLVWALAFSSCTKTADGIPGAAGTAGANGNPVSDQRSGIMGYVQLVSQFTVPLTENGGVTVSTKMGDSSLSVKTDAAGSFLLPNLKSGTYRILFQRDGYDSLALNIVHSAGNEDKFIGIVQMAGTQTTHFVSQKFLVLQSPFDNVSKYVDITTTVTGSPVTDSAMRYVNLFFSSSDKVSAQNYLFLFQTYTHNEGGNSFETQVFFGGSEINSTRFKPGDTVYVKTYIIPPYSFTNGINKWFDTNTYQSVPYPYIGDSTLNYFIWVK